MLLDGIAVVAYKNDSALLVERVEKFEEASLRIGIEIGVGLVEQ